MIQSSRQPAAHRRRRQKGNAVIESALIILPLFAVGFAMMDFALALFIQNTLREAVREGVRYAITEQTGSGGQDAAIKSTVENASMGFLTDADISSGVSSFSINYYDSNLNAVSGVNSNAPGNLIVVSATINRKWMAPLWRGTGLIPFSAYSSDIMESAPNNITPTR
ncbi:MAG: pilus assembly protein [Acidobacteriia bacterium]|nr:pilus assembly protein [Terriglobia bacterium]